MKSLKEFFSFLRIPKTTAKRRNKKNINKKRKINKRITKKRNYSMKGG